MASSENLASFDTWAFRPMFTDSWISEAYVRDTETLTKALQKSLYNTANTSVVTSGIDDPKSFSETLTSDSINTLLNLIPSSDTTLPPATPTGSNLSGSEPETVPSKRHKTNNTSVGGASRKVSKRKSRASKRTQTTFITADPANFRQMVQQVTGVRFGNSQGPVVPVLKPEPQRASSRLQESGGCLPTLDTSSFLLDHHQQQVLMGNGPVVGLGPMGVTNGVVGPDGGAVNSAFDFDTFSSFPTLESNSWKVM